MARKGLSVISPILNEEFFLPLYLESVSQYADEILLLDGGSTDESINIIKDFQSQKKTSIKFWQLPQRGKPYSDDWQEGVRRNFLINRASYEWILALDVDEFLSDNFNDVFNEKVLKGSGTLYGFRFISLWKDPDTVRLNTPEDPHWEGIIYRLIRKDAASYSIKGNHSHLLCYGNYPWLFKNKDILDEVTLFHYHYALGKKIKNNDNRRGDVNCLHEEEKPDWNYDPGIYRIKTSKFTGKHPNIIKKYLERGDK